MTRSRTQIWIDRGGTFTDCLAWHPRGPSIRVAKVLSSDEAPIAGIRGLLDVGPGDPIPPCDVRMGTTLATNALLERGGTPTGLVITRGFGDLLWIGDQTRPDLFALRIPDPQLLYREVLEVEARLDAEGNVLERPDPLRLRAELEAMRARGVESLAVVVLHAHRDGALERDIGAVAADSGFEHVSLSHEVSAELGLLGRGDTTVADAYLTPLIGAYVRRLLRDLPGSTLRIMQSSGGLAEAGRFRGRDAVLSGPAGGVVAVSHVARLTGEARVVGFDMGGTSTDVCRFGGEVERTYETKVAGVRLRAPMVAVHTVAAGGGSICRLEGGRFVVGPDSAGAAPGPLCYGDPEARELTLTDVNLALGRVREDRFPFPLVREPVDAALDRLAEQLRRTGEETLTSAPVVADGFFRVAIENMAAAIRRISVEQGHDVREHALIVFGGAGGQHACALARRLGMRRIVSHPLAGVLSAWGMGVAPVTWHGEADAVGRPLDEGLLPGLEASFVALEARGRGAMDMTAPDLRGASLEVARRIDLRYRGTETALTLALSLEDRDVAHLRARFDAVHRRELGHHRPGHPVEAVVARLELRAGSPEPAGGGPALGTPLPTSVGAGPVRPVTEAPLWLEGRFRQVPVLHRESLESGARLSGPALILEETGTFVVEPGFALEVDAGGLLLLEDRGGSSAAFAASARVDPVLLEIFGNLYMSIAAQMGTVLRRTALSTNIRERLDFSCAVFDGDGGLVANAPHIPVHLGAMGESVQAVRRAYPEPAPGDVFLTNDPAHGGSHLPDLTVVSPVHTHDGRLRFYAASRGHHADVGGITPGSMPPFSTSLSEEGVVLPAQRIVRGGRFEREAVRRLFTAGPHPARRPEDNLADLSAQIAANRKGQELLLEMVAHHGSAVVEAYMRHVQDNAEARVCEAILGLPDGEHRYEDAMDDGTPVAVLIRVDGDRMVVDFEGTGPEAKGNLNTPRAVTVAAVLYVLRTLVGAPIPLNSGCLRPVELRIPCPSLLCPGPERAVAGGNVETSQRVVDVLLGALGRAAASQGTMNNLTFGDASFGYYETIGGGAGAGPGFDGASGVHTHMTNSRITDPEVLESRFPVRLWRFALRRGSGGLGRHRGGDGLVREIEFLSPMRVAILSERRVRAPFGLEGGEEGARGRNLHRGLTVPGKAAFGVLPGDRVCIETPGGGGWGSR